MGATAWHRQAVGCVGQKPTGKKKRPQELVFLSGAGAGLLADGAVGCCGDLAARLSWAETGCQYLWQTIFQRK